MLQAGLPAGQRALLHTHLLYLLPASVLAAARPLSACTHLHAGWENVSHRVAVASEQCCKLVQNTLNMKNRKLALKW